MEIHKKILPEHFDALVSGEKTFELRLNDEDLKDAKPGDVLVLEEWNSTGPSRQPTGRTIRKTISRASRLPLMILLKCGRAKRSKRRASLFFRSRIEGAQDV